MVMKSPQIANLLRKRLRALQDLSQEITAGQKACIRLDFDAVRTHDEHKQSICAEIGIIEREINVLRGDPENDGLFRSFAVPTELSLAHDKDREALRRLWAESEAARAEAGERNQVYAEFLRRAQSTGRLMMNVIAHCLGVYPSEAFPVQFHIERSV